MKKIVLSLVAVSCLCFAGCEDKKKPVVTETPKGGVTVDAPGVKVDAGKDGTSVQAPGVDVNVERK